MQFAIEKMEALHSYFHVVRSCQQCISTVPNLGSWSQNAWLWVERLSYYTGLLQYRVQCLRPATGKFVLAEESSAWCGVCWCSMSHWEKTRLAQWLKSSTHSRSLRIRNPVPARWICAVVNFSKQETSVYCSYGFQWQAGCWHRLTNHSEKSN